MKYERNEKYFLKLHKMRILHIKLYEMQLKQSLEGNFVFNAYIREEEISQINNLSFHFTN